MTTGKRNQHGPPLVELLVFGLTDVQRVRDWMETRGGAEGQKRATCPEPRSKNLWDILRSVVSSKKDRQKENDTS